MKEQRIYKDDRGGADIVGCDLNICRQSLTEYYNQSMTSITHTVSVVLYWLCSICYVVSVVLYRLYSTGCIVSVVLHWLYCFGCIVLVVLYWLYCIILVVVYQLGSLVDWQMLDWLSCCQQPRGNIQQHQACIILGDTVVRWGLIETSYVSPLSV